MAVSKDGPVRVALIGYGLAGSVFHAPLIHHTPGLELSAIVTTNSERKAHALHHYPHAQILADAEEIWNHRDRYDLVVVATTNETHAALAKNAMQAGLAVVVDKPFAISTREAQDMLSVQRETGSLLTVFQNRRWDADFRTVQELIESGKVGAVTRLESRYERYRLQPKPGGWRETTAAERGGGLLFDLGSHLIDQALVLFGRPVSVYAELKTRRSASAADDDSFIALQFASDVCVHLWVSLLAKVPGPRFRLLGTHGVFEKYGMDPQEDALRSGARPGMPHWGLEPPQQWGKLAANLDGIEFSGTIQTLPGQYERFYEIMRDAVAQGGPVPVDPNDALVTLQVVESARLSASSNSSVPLAI